MTTASKFDAAKYNEAVTLVVNSLRLAGVDAKVAKAQFGELREVKLTVDGEPLDVRSLSKNYNDFGGFVVRYDWMGRRGMGTIRYPLKKNGGVDIARLQADIESHRRRVASRKESEDLVAKNKRALKAAHESLERLVIELQGAAGAGLYIEVENDGRESGRLRFKVSGHATPARVRALLSAVEETQPFPKE